MGKSSLLNALAGRRNLARTSRTPGKTQALNVFNLDDRAYFVDLPGYGYARAPRTVRQALSRLICAYFDARRPAGVAWLLDLRRDPSPEDLAMGALLAQRSLPVLLTLTKADKIPRGRRRQRTEAILQALGMSPAAAHVVLTSARTGEGIPTLRAALQRLLDQHTPGPETSAAARRGRRLSTLLIGLATTAALATSPAPAPAQDTTQAAANLALPPPGYGTLRQEQVAIRLRTGTFLLRVLPLDERVIRLLAPDSYAALHRAAESAAGEVAQATARLGIQAPTLFLVTFFGLQDRARFVPDDVTITSRNRFFRPVAILPITPRWSEQILSQRETASAVYVYEEGIALFEPIAVSYGGTTSTDWEGILPTLDRERAAVLARAARNP